MELNCTCFHCKQDREKANKVAHDKWMARLEAKKAEEAEAIERKAESERLKREAKTKQDCKYRFMMDGGSEAAFEKRWPVLKEQSHDKAALGAAAPSSVDEIAQRKRASGLYGNLSR